jgi:DNA repair exonuclease SbcCD ATPase subunit
MPTVTAEPNDSLTKIVTEGGLSGNAATWLVQQFTPFVIDASPLIESAMRITVTDATQVAEIKEARRLRLALRAIRVEAEKHRKEIKADALKTSQCIDAAGRWVASKIEPIEERLHEMETFAERAEAERKSKVKASREILLAPFGVDTAFIDLANMPEDSFNTLLSQARSAHEAKLAAQAKAEADKIAAEKARAAEQERIRIENERLRAEAQAREAEAKKEREALAAAAAAERAKAEKERAEAESKLRAEQQAREALEAREREARAAEARLLAEKEAARQAAEQAPDQEKLVALATAIRSLPLPNMATKAGQSAIDSIRRQINSLADSIESALKGRL